MTIEVTQQDIDIADAYNLDMQGGNRYIYLPIGSTINPYRLAYRRTVRSSVYKSLGSKVSGMVLDYHNSLALSLKPTAVPTTFVVDSL